MNLFRPGAPIQYLIRGTEWLKHKRRPLKFSLLTPEQLCNAVNAPVNAITLDMMRTKAKSEGKYLAAIDLILNTEHDRFDTG